MKSISVLYKEHKPFFVISLIIVLPILVSIFAFQQYNLEKSIKSIEMSMDVELSKWTEPYGTPFVVKTLPPFLKAILTKDIWDQYKALSRAGGINLDVDLIGGTGIGISTPLGGEEIVWVPKSQVEGFVLLAPHAARGSDTSIGKIIAQFLFILMIYLVILAIYELFLNKKENPIKNWFYK